MGWRLSLPLVSLALACSSGPLEPGLHFAKAEELVRDGRWDESRAEYNAGCAALVGEEAKKHCLERADATYGAGAATASTVAVATPPVATRAPTTAPSAPPAPAGGDFVQGAPQPAAYAIVIGIEHYADLPPPTGAATDARDFARLAARSLGVADDHTKVLLDDKATKGSIERALEWARTTVRGGGRLYFYFSGHGAPDTASGSAYIVPYDGDPKYLAQTALPVSTVLSTLASSPAREVLVMFDSCFSGAGGRSVLPAGARPLVRIKDTAPPANARLAVFAAADDAEISGPAAEGNRGLFSKYLVEGLGQGHADADGDGQISLRELSAWVTPRVTREAKDDHREQHPKTTLAAGMGDGSDFMIEWGLPSK